MVLNAIGIVSGESFQRFNTWHIITQPDALLSGLVNGLVGQSPGASDGCHVCGDYNIVLADETGKSGNYAERAHSPRFPRGGDGVTAVYAYLLTSGF